MTPQSPRKFQLSLIPATLAAVVPAFIAMAFAGVLVTRADHVIDQTMQRMYETHMELVFDSMRQVRALERLQRSGRMLILLDDATAREQLRKELESIAIDGSLQGSEENRSALHNAFVLLDRCVVDLRVQPKQARTRCLEDWQPLDQALVDRMEAISAQASTSAADDLDTLVDASSRAGRWAMLAVGIGIAALLMLSVCLYFLVGRPLLRVTRILGQARQGKCPTPGHQWLREVQLLDDAAVALAETHREVHAARVDLEMAANTDQLTGLANRRSFAATATAEMGRCQRYKMPLAVVCMDIDHFKCINDRFGHEGGDVALRALAQFLKGAVRAIDTPARLGGEEFAIITPTATAAEAAMAAERLRTGLAAMPIEMPDGSVINLTSSFGVAAVRDSENDLQGALQRADTVLYRAKENGRNRVEVSD